MMAAQTTDAAQLNTGVAELDLASSRPEARSWAEI
jgi:hypothetical protein